VLEVPQAHTAGRPTRHSPTRVSASWTAVVVGALSLIVLVTFIAQNTQRAAIQFLWVHGRAPIGIIVLAAAIAGAVSVITVAAVRMLELRRTCKAERMKTPTSPKHT
jgi:uncharacterized integral membrane protein